MHAAILRILTGDPDVEELPNRLGSGLPAATAGQVRYLDDRTINYGTVAGQITDETRVPVVGDDAIHSETEEVTRRTSAEYYADLETGWAGADSGDGTTLLTDYLASAAGVIPEESQIYLEGFAQDLPDTADLKGIVYSQSIDDGQPRDAAGSHWHYDADRDKLPAEGVSALAVEYTWDGVLVDAMLAASGYVAVYNSDWSTEIFGRWVANEVEPHLDYASDSQATLGDGGGDDAE